MCIVFVIDLVDVDNKSSLPATRDQSSENCKKIKIERDNSVDVAVNATNLVSLLSNGLNRIKNKSNNTLLLTTEQLVAARKLISAAQPAIVNTYVTSKPILVPRNVMTDSTCNRKKDLSNVLSIVDSTCSRNKDLSNVLSIVENHDQMSPTYPKIVNPVSIKAERTDMDCVMRPPVGNQRPCQHQQYLNRVDTNVTRPTITSNTSAALNLNEINRSQSEIELMALVDGDDVTADGKFLFDSV